VRGVLTITADVSESATPPPGTEFLPDELPPEQSAELVALARLVLNAALYPATLPADPLPAPLELALAIVTRRLYNLAPGSSTGQVVSESIGSYSYSLASPESLDTAALIEGPVSGLIAPWRGQTGVYEIDLKTSVSKLGWPIDWWQRDLDNVVAAIDAGDSP
jgi:hypothetical protein